MFYQQGVKYKRPTKNIDGQQRLVSRIVMEKHLNRKLKSNELVHHINCNTFDNRIENLLLTDRSEHKKIHNEIGMKTRLKKKYNFNENEIIELYFKYKKVIVVAKIYGCQEMTIERALRKALHCVSLKEFAIKQGWKTIWRDK